MPGYRCATFRRYRVIGLWRLWSDIWVSLRSRSRTLSLLWIFEYFYPKFYTIVVRPLPIIKCPAVAFALRAKAPRYLGCAKNIIDTAGHFISWIPLRKTLGKQM